MRDICKDLNADQQKAVQADVNAVISAGAGSGKTKVLASRFVYLITEKNYQVENILALTFTEKAAAEMHQRIYKELKTMAAETDDPQQKARAETALHTFFKAQIMTIDAFCHKIAVTACRRFGISPDFTIDLAESKRLAYNLSLDFFLEHRADSGLQYLLGNKSITAFLNDFFVKFLSSYTTVSKPIDFPAALEHQLSAAEDLYTAISPSIDRLLQDIASYFSINDTFINAVKEAAASLPETPLTLDAPQFPAFLDGLEHITRVKKNTGKRNEEVKACKAHCTELTAVYGRVQNLYQFYAHKELIRDIYMLCADLQNRYITEKKRKSILDFNDIAQLAVDALLADPDLRLFYKKQIRRIMIDEFQDNNSLQRDQLFLLAEKDERTEASIPQPDELLPDKLFFVGDEKQSIYAFRGADVSVFRRLAQDLRRQDGSAAINLQTNYRTEPDLLEFFNRVFTHVFYSEHHRPAEGAVPHFEAEFIPILHRTATEGLHPQADIFFIDEKRFPSIETIGEPLMQPIECEAYTLAQKMAALHAEGYRVYDDGKKTARPCTWSDFAVLLRASTYQPVYERFFRLFKIPYISVQQRGLFQDAPLNDICALLRLAVYPHDRAVYAQVLRSPFVHLGDRSFTQLMLHSTEHRTEPFNPADAPAVEPEDRSYFLQACELFERIREYSKKKSNAELITALWYDEGYRYVLLTDVQYHRYLELYDYLFALAVKADAAKVSLSTFIDSIDSYIHGEQQVEDMEIPVEHGGDAVKIMTVHKSKGLEFPIVCIPGCGSEGQGEKKDGMIFLHKDYGPVMHLPQTSKKAPSASIFFEELREEANAKLLAESKRLLYVALTRAKVRLLMSGVQSTNCKDEDLPESPRTLQEIRQQLVQPKKQEQNKSFFQLLLPAAPDDMPCVHFEEVMPLPVSVLQTVNAEYPPLTGADAREHYLHAAEKRFQLAEPRIIPATQFEKDRQWLHLSGERQYDPRKEGEILNEDTEQDGTITDARNNTTVSDGTETGATLPDEDTLSYTEFGTLVHKAIESRFLEQPYTLPAKYAPEVEKLCAAFFSSPIGQKALAADFRKTEYGFVTIYGGKLVIGQIDLLFEDEQTVYVVDYKTDQKIYPERHREQLLIYKAAAKNFYKMEGFGSDRGGKTAAKQIKAYIFYLRSQTAVEVE